MSEKTTDGGGREGRQARGQAPKRTLTEDISVRVGLPTGIGAYLLGYLITYVLLLMEAPGALNDYVSPDSNHIYEPVGWVYHGAHAVDVSRSNLNGAQDVNYLLNLDYVYGLSIPPIVFYAIPVVVLVFAGYQTVRRLEIPNRLTSGVIAGGSIVFGYFIMAVFGAYFFEFLVAGQGSKPDATMSALLIGLAYPIVAGAIGGAIAVSVPSVKEVPAVQQSK